MNKDSEQLRFDASVIIDQDQPLTKNEIYNTLCDFLGKENISKQRIFGRNVFVYSLQNKNIILLTKSVTYLGNPHPIFKKRIQLPDWYQEFCAENEKSGNEYDVRFIGIYHYNETLILVDFIKETYLRHGLHNSSAHVYVNDLYQGMIYGIFRKEDKFGNSIVVIRNDKFASYLKGDTNNGNTLFDLFRKFNCGFSFGVWLYALDIIREMHEGEWRNWRQTEWAGWFLEYKFDKFTKENKTLQQIRYVGSSNKRAGEFDFDLRFEEEDFYGDLKASDITKKETPGNDQNTLAECIYRYRKFWYVIYEHETKKDSDSTDNEAAMDRINYIKSVDPAYYEKLINKKRANNEDSHSRKLKHSVKFTKMSIIELNAVNYLGALKVFNQGRQPDGSLRKPKFNIDKKVLENDNYVIFRYNYQQNN